ncbi:heat shock factor 2-binding protein isoform X4 [Equus asinus]|uniref:Heat shock transcription factor 2 binding protein n=1 Tax=Equus asinus TaxID=9793 RepID=A0A9L0I843_EQUAS|nr:heat shock factor 2-binding protein isoform X1 [Equus asinus]
MANFKWSRIFKPTPQKPHPIGSCPAKYTGFQLHWTPRAASAGFAVNRFKTPAEPEERGRLSPSPPRVRRAQRAAQTLRSLSLAALCSQALGVDALPRFLACGVRGRVAAQAHGAEAVAAMGEAGDVEEACWHVGAKEEFVKVRKKDLERLTTEVMQIRDFLPRILNGEVLESFQKLKIMEKNLERKEQEIEQLRMDCEHFKARLETVQADSMRDKKEKLVLRQQLNEAKQQLLQQAEYCTEMGAAACTLLWGVSSSEEVVKAILGGDKALKFFSITGQTMESFVKSLDGDVKELDSDENQFVFALAGIVTNVAAIACGREFLVNSSRVLLDTMLQLLGDLKPGQCTKLKVLMLMSLYNVSINLKGLKYISESPGFIPLLWWLLSDPDAEVCLHVLRLVQSVVLEPEVFSKSASEFRSSLPLQRIVAMSKSRNPHLQTVAQELLEDLRALQHDV